MANGLSNDDSGKRSRNKSKQPEAILFNDAVGDETLDAHTNAAHDELSDAPPTITSEMSTPEKLEVETEMASVVRTEHPLRLIEAHWEAKRLNALLKEVYDEE